MQLSSKQTQKYQKHSLNKTLLRLAHYA